MAQLKFTTALSGPDYSLNAGDERDFPADEALRLVDAHIAVPADDAARAEIEAVRADLAAEAEALAAEQAEPEPEPEPEDLSALDMPAPAPAVEAAPAKKK